MVQSSMGETKKYVQMFVWGGWGYVILFSKAKPKQFAILHILNNREKLTCKRSVGQSCKKQSRRTKIRTCFRKLKEWQNIQIIYSVKDGNPRLVNKKQEANMQKHACQNYSQRIIQQKYVTFNSDENRGLYSMS